jgi:hypothetical protein
MSRVISILSAGRGTARLAASPRRGGRANAAARRRFAVALASVVAASAALLLPGATAAVSGPSAGANVRATVDNGVNGPYMSADELAGGSYTDAVLQRCGTDRRM